MKLLYILALWPLSSWGYTVTTEYKLRSPQEQDVTIQFMLEPEEYLYKESLIISTDSPAITLSGPVASQESISFFDAAHNQDREGYTGNISFVIRATRTSQPVNDPARLHAHFTVSSSAQPQELSYPLTFETATTAEQAALQARPTKAPTRVKCAPIAPSLVGNFASKLTNWINQSMTQARALIESLFADASYNFIRFLAALLLGILLSLTPCIYPMIPITIGVLQANGTASGFTNFLLALSYTLGISLTFALFGFLAALGSCIFGELQGSPFLILPLSALLLYFGLTMFDVVQLPIPRILQAPRKVTSQGSFVSAFLFGALSGTVASPCLSPGLVLILNYVTSITQSHTFMSYLEGFLLLFVFGIGSSLPLLIIGTFSGSLQLLPQAGAWMVEVKKLVGLMLIGMALYHLSHLEWLIPWHIFVFVIVLTCLALGIYYFMSREPYDSRGMKYYKNSMGTLLIMLSCLASVHAYKVYIDYVYPEAPMQKWMHDYQAALMRARATHTPLFISIGASYCSACKALDAQIFAQQCLQDTLALFTLLKVEADMHTTSYAALKKHFQRYIKGYPTYLAIDPRTEKVIDSWDVTLSQKTLDGIEEELLELVKSYQAQTGT